MRSYQLIMQIYIHVLTHNAKILKILFQVNMVKIPHTKHAENQNLADITYKWHHITKASKGRLRNNHFIKTECAEQSICFKSHQTSMLNPQNKNGEYGSNQHNRWHPTNQACQNVSGCFNHVMKMKCFKKEMINISNISFQSQSRNVTNQWVQRLCNVL